MPQPTQPTEHTWDIIDQHGRKRRVTLAEFRAELDRRAALSAPIMDAWRRGDLVGCGAAQAAMREACR